MKKADFDLLFPEGITSGQITPYVHKGRWAVHEVLPILLDWCGPAIVRVATFNISEDSLRPMFFLKDEGKIKDLSLLLDMNVKRHKLDILLFAANIADSVRISSTHMKVLLVENDLFRGGLVGSANMNNNPRYEAGVAFSDTKMFDYYRDCFDEIFKNDSLPFYGING